MKFTPLVGIFAAGAAIKKLKLWLELCVLLYLGLFTT